MAKLPYLPHPPPVPSKIPCPLSWPNKERRPFLSLPFLFPHSLSDCFLHLHFPFIDFPFCPLKKKKFQASTPTPSLHPSRLEASNIHLLN